MISFIGPLDVCIFVNFFITKVEYEPTYGTTK